MNCDVCGREKRSTIPSVALKQMDARWCRSGGQVQAGHDEAECYRLGYERMIARAGKADPPEAP